MTIYKMLWNVTHERIVLKCSEIIKHTPDLETLEEVLSILASLITDLDATQYYKIIYGCNMVARVKYTNVREPIFEVYTKVKKDGVMEKYQQIKASKYLGGECCGS